MDNYDRIWEIKGSTKRCEFTHLQNYLKKERKEYEKNKAGYLPRKNKFYFLFSPKPEEDNMYLNLEFIDKEYQELPTIIESDVALNSIVKKITYFPIVNLENGNDNDELDNFQVFTPRFIVDLMIDSIGKKIIESNDTKILEPTSGDGAFTCRILEIRLKNNLKNKNTLFTESLKSLTTIYSIEMDEHLIEKQRSNIFSTFVNFFNSQNIVLEAVQLAIIKTIIATNFIWAMTNMEFANTQIICDLAYVMPEAASGVFSSIKIPVWNIMPNSASVKYEDI